MSGPNHIAGGLVFTGIYLSMWDENIYSRPHFVFFTALFSLLPDVDHTRSMIGKPFYPIAVYLDRKFGHRTITHSLLCYGLLALLVGIIERTWFDTITITRIFLWAYGSHLILDMLTLQGIPLFYPFKKNPCVIPGNPKFRFRSSDFRTESIVFSLFVLLAFTCKDLFAKGFWNTYNSSFGTVRHLNNEQQLTDRMIEVAYDFTKGGTRYQGRGVLVSSTDSKALIFDNGFLEVHKEDHIKRLIPYRTTRQLQTVELSFTGISFDSLQRLLRNKPITALKLEASLPMYYQKDKRPESGTSVVLEHVYNPVLRSSDADSIDLAVQKELELLKMEMRSNAQEQTQYAIDKARALKYLNETKQKLESNDLAEKEKAIQEYPKALATFNTLKAPPDRSGSLLLKQKFLSSRLLIRKRQTINGYIAYLTNN